MNRIEPRRDCRGATFTQVSRECIRIELTAGNAKLFGQMLSGFEYRVRNRYGNLHGIHGITMV